MAKITRLKLFLRQLLKKEIETRFALIFSAIIVSIVLDPLIWDKNGRGIQIEFAKKLKQTNYQLYDDQHIKKAMEEVDEIGVESPAKIKDFMIKHAVDTIHFLLFSTFCPPPPEAITIAQINSNNPNFLQFLRENIASSKVKSLFANFRSELALKQVSFESQKYYRHLFFSLFSDGRALRKNDIEDALFVTSGDGNSLFVSFDNYMINFSKIIVLTVGD